MSNRPKRAYDSRRREKAAAATRKRVLRTATTLFTRRGIDAVTINELAEQAGVSGATVYALFKSKEGVIRALVERVLFGSKYQVAIDRLNAEGDPVDQIRMTASVARAIYEGEAVELGLLRGASSFSVALRKMEHELEKKRFALQEARVSKLYAAKKGNETLSIEKARVLLWMYTSRDVYRLLVQEGRFSPDEYEQWLAGTLVDALVSKESGDVSTRIGVRPSPPSHRRSHGRDR